VAQRLLLTLAFVIVLPHRVAHEASVSLRLSAGAILECSAAAARPHQRAALSASARTIPAFRSGATRPAS